MPTICLGRLHHNLAPARWPRAERARLAAAQRTHRALELCRRLLDSELGALAFFVALILTTFVV